MYIRAYDTSPYTRPERSHYSTVSHNSDARRGLALNNLAYVFRFSIHLGNPHFSKEVVRSKPLADPVFFLSLAPAFESLRKRILNTVPQYPKYNIAMYNPSHRNENIDEYLWASYVFGHFDAIVNGGIAAGCYYV